MPKFNIPIRLRDDPQEQDIVVFEADSHEQAIRYAENKYRDTIYEVASSSSGNLWPVNCGSIEADIKEVIKMKKRGLNKDLIKDELVGYGLYEPNVVNAIAIVYNLADADTDALFSELEHIGRDLDDQDRNTMQEWLVRGKYITEELYDRDFFHELSTKRVGMTQKQWDANPEEGVIPGKLYPIILTQGGPWRVNLAVKIEDDPRYASVSMDYDSQEWDIGPK